jgi:hypothetical protein
LYSHTAETQRNTYLPALKIEWLVFLLPSAIKDAHYRKEQDVLLIE